MSSPLLRYRAMAYVVGVALLVLVLVAMPLKYLADEPAAVRVVAPVHGALFVVYLVTAAHLALLKRWSVVRTLVVVAAGAVPFLSFVMERRIVAEESAR